MNVSHELVGISGDNCKGPNPFARSRVVRVYDVDGNLLGSARLRPGDDVEVAAKKLLREKHGVGGFYGRINYRRSSLH
jgi:hypothetical protein